MVRPLDSSLRAIALTISLGSLIHASPFPQQLIGPNANLDRSAQGEQYRGRDDEPVGYGPSQQQRTGVVYTTETTTEYTTNSITETVSPSPLRPSTTRDATTASLVPPTTSLPTTSPIMTESGALTEPALPSSSSSVVTTTTSTVAPSTSAASPCGPAVTPPAPTNAGTVADCTLWYIAHPGDYCYTVAEEFGIDVDTFMAWNPSVLPPTCPHMLAGDAYCVRTCGSEISSRATVSSAAVTASSTSVSSGPASSASLSSTSSTLLTTTTTSSSFAQASSTTPSSPASSANPTASPSSVVYRSFNGDGTVAAGWPTEDQWIPFATMFTINTPAMLTACQAWGVPDNSADEIATMREQILSIGDATGIEPRFILAVIMQESTGCVRVITTAYSHANPGLMQSFNGTGSCNANSAPLGIPGVTPVPDGVQTPCPASEIRQQILDGTNGTVWGPGLVQDLAEQGRTDSSRWYRTARLYNGGSIVDSNLALPCCTASYASDIANRLLGWTNGPREFVQQ